MLIFSAFFVCFGASIGMMTGIIVGRVLRFFGALAFGRSRELARKQKQVGDPCGLFDGPAV